MGKHWWEFFCSLGADWSHHDGSSSSSNLLLETAFNNNFLDKLGAEKLSLLMRELGKCSRWESVHRSKRPGIE